MNFAPWNTGSRIKAVVGHYGSGKTEFSLNMALAARAAGRRALVADMDIVNPFFRSAEQGERLKRAGVELIAPPYALTGVDLPVLSPEIYAIFEQPERFCVLDVGGDDAGAAALGGLSGRLAAQGADLYYVVNPYRPFSNTVERVMEMMERIQRRARLQVTGLVNNANLGEETGAEELLEGRTLLEKVSRRCGVPVVCECGFEGVLQQLPPGPPSFPIARYLMPEWLL
ncbi:MAG TPA: ParA family protein [Candidatus Excrementavichristensenella intestinipullorum]|nr:ParA family protein [Candidatus Excrementavichristensenella intestinipullorum]